MSKVSKAVKESVTVVNKEEIPSFVFSESDVLSTDGKRKERSRRIERALRLGNGFKRKVKIIFEDITGIKKVETTIWGFTGENIILKKAALIPTRSVHQVRFY